MKVTNATTTATTGKTMNTPEIYITSRIDDPKPGELFIDSQVLEDAYQSGYVTGYADARERLSMPGIYRQLYYFSLISGLAGFAIGALVARMP